MFRNFKAWIKLWWIEVLINHYDDTIQRLIDLEKERSLGVYKYMHKPAALRSYRIKMQGRADKLKQHLADTNNYLAKLGVHYN